jgi:hypothetical protein
LFTTVFSKDARWDDQLVAAVLSLATALASIQLLAKHRTSEKQTAIRAAQLEVKRTPIIQWPEPTERKAPEKHRRSVAKPMRHDGRRSIPRRKVGILRLSRARLAAAAAQPVLQYFTVINIATECDRGYRMAGFLN